MVREKFRNGRKLYICKVCGLAYKERIWAEKCQDFCKKYGACSIEIIPHAVNEDNK